MPKLFDPTYPDGFIEVEHINAYLLAAPDIYVEPRSTPFFRVPKMIYGSKPTDDGNFLLTADLRKAHRENDAAVMSLYAFLPDMPEDKFQIRLLEMYDSLRQDFADAED